MDQQAAGGEDPNKPSKKKSNEDESKNKKLVCIIASEFSLLLLLSYVTHKCMRFCREEGSFHNMGAANVYNKIFFKNFFPSLCINAREGTLKSFCIFADVLIELPITTQKLVSACYC